MLAPANRPTTRARKGSGSVTWIAARGQYRVRVPRQDRPGSPYDQWSPGPESPAARKVADDLRIATLADLARGVPIIDRTRTVGAWLDEWLANQSGKKPQTVRAYRQRVEWYLMPFLDRVRLADLAPHHIQSAYQRLRTDGSPRGRGPVSETTIGLAHKVLIAALNDARRADPPLVATNQAERVTVRHDSPDIEPPTIDQVQRLVDVLDPTDQMRPFYLVAFWTGARQGEIFGLRWSDVDADGRTLAYRKQAPQRGDGERTRRPLKAGRPRTIVVPQVVIDALDALPRHPTSTLVFHTSTGKPLNQRNVKRHFDDAQARAAIAPPQGADLDHFRLHDLRHAWATTMLSAGATAVLVQGLGGWSSLDMLDRYGHVRPQRGGRAYQLVVDALGADDARDFYGIR
jgi:integrase